MGDSNNHRAGSLPATPNPALSRLDPLVGTWEISGSLVHGRVRFEWMTGGHYLIQHVALVHSGRTILGVEYIGYDEDTGTLRSHFMDSNGANFTYTWDLIDRSLSTWFGERDSTNSFSGELSEDGNSYQGAWEWPDGQGGVGGYAVNAARVHP